MPAIRRICAWCCESEGVELDFDVPTTHGLCSRCFTARMADVLVPGARKRHYRWAGVSDADRILAKPEERKLS
jgi:hypothetical protein